LKKQFSSGKQNLPKKWMEISLRGIILTILDTCSDKKVNETITSHGVAPKLLGSKHQVKENSTDAHSKTSEMKI
jgi:hypothetical protein